MALTLEQEDALVALLDEPSISIDELPKMEQINDFDLLLASQNFEEKSVTVRELKDYISSVMSEKLDSISSAINEKLDNIYPIGSPVPWSQEFIPDGYLRCNGASFDKVKYPKLAIAYPSGILPDLRGEFIRGWDDGRGIDDSRQILSWQEGGYLVSVTVVPGKDPIVYEIKENNDSNSRTINIESQSSITPLLEAGDYSGNAIATPRNVAFLYIVKAA